MRIYGMPFRIRALLLFALLVHVCAAPVLAQSITDPSSAISEVIGNHQFDLSTTGRDFLLNEARDSDYFLLGELHGENEIPALLRSIWPQMWKDGYRHIGAEISPWAASQLEMPENAQGPKIIGLWTRRQADDARIPSAPGATVLWGCDMEEIQPEALIAELLRLNPHNRELQQMAEITKSGGYSRKRSPELLELAQKLSGLKDEQPGGISLCQNLIATLQIDKARTDPATKMLAQNERELLMKEQLLQHLRHDSLQGSKVLLRFGRNHLHRGYDARGISTLGNFVAEYAVAHGQRAFNVGVFAAGGKESLLGETWNADERGDEPAFALLAEKAKSDVAIFDLRPLRQLLHAIPLKERTSLQTNLIYWADSYDALICYRIVTPLIPGE